MRRIRLQFATVHGAGGSKTVNKLVLSLEKDRNNNLELVSVDGACGSTLLAYAAHAVANC
jgi:hypothetical protein